MISIFFKVYLVEETKSVYVRVLEKAWVFYQFLTVVYTATVSSCLLCSFSNALNVFYLNGWFSHMTIYEEYNFLGDGSCLFYLWLTGSNHRTQHILILNLFMLNEVCRLDARRDLVLCTSSFGLLLWSLSKLEKIL